MRVFSLIVLHFVISFGSAFGHGKPTLLVFSGSDWCIPCINFENNILSTTVFKNYSEERLNLVRADFPQRKQLSKEQEAKNEMLAELYNPQGNFPSVVLLDENGIILKRINTNIDDPKLLIQQIESALPSKTLKEYRKKCILMGSSFEFTIVLYDDKVADSLLQACILEVQRIENLISEWIPESEVSLINLHAGNSAVAISDEVYQLTDRCITLSTLTNGAFDITFRGINLYDFDNREHASFPDSNEIVEALSKVGHQNIALLPSNKIMLRKKGMAIGFGASGKGYAADRVKKLMINAGVTAGVINASGDLTCWGTPPDGNSWKVGISNPDNAAEMLYWLPVENSAVATSGSYEKFFIYQGKRYAHILNPKNGLPVSDKKSVTVFSNSAELSDALATALFAMPIDKGLALIESLPDVKALIIDEQNKVYPSKKLQLIE